MAELAGCHDVLFDRCFDEAMKTFDPSTTGGLLAKLRRKQAMTFLHNSVSGKVWAFMRYYWTDERYEEAKKWLGERLKLYYDNGHPEVRRFMDTESRIPTVTIDSNDASYVDEAPSTAIIRVKQEVQ
ncbi:hypothetical protein NKR23_g12268 [Pleurostoma richardsiae]|uniref:Uncharacterized protein n=1 Tax=Pleurostoma richardsiae TaxID=41990 RepID=A0AA38R2F5_9PEZI|nr:hypothetical protein NKR23_g12268 [Pleurostoma richardsiae]